MKLRMNGFENEINMDNTINVIQINNPQLLVHFIEIINEKMDGVDNNEIMLLDDENNEVNFPKEVSMVFDLFNMEYNSKKILGKIYEYISTKLDSNQDKLLSNANNKVRKKLVEELNELPINFEINDDINTSDLLKAYNVRLDETTYKTLLDRIELLIEILSLMHIASILVLPNLKSYLTEEQLVELYKYSLYNNISLIILENRNWRRLKYERVLRIDSEFDEILM